LVVFIVLPFLSFTSVFFLGAVFLQSFLNSYFLMYLVTVVSLVEGFVRVPWWAYVEGFVLLPLFTTLILKKYS
jgi:hypothetical protein